jgi:DNA helicase HerA-like ATPase
MCEKLSIRQNEWFWPKHPFRSLIIGPTGSGKSNLLLNMLFGCEEDGSAPGLNYDRVYYYLKDELEDKFQFIKTKFERIERKLKREKGIEFKIFTYGTEMDDIVDFRDIDKDLMTLVIFDDFLASKDQTVIKNLFLAGRKRNASMIYLSQSFFRVPMLIREQVSHVVLFRTKRQDEIGPIANRYASGISVKEFKQFYEVCVSKAYGFMMIDLTEGTELPMRYRCGLAGLYTG